MFINFFHKCTTVGFSEGEVFPAEHFEEVLGDPAKTPVSAGVKGVARPAGDDTYC